MDAITWNAFQDEFEKLGKRKGQDALVGAAMLSTPVLPKIVDKAALKAFSAPASPRDRKLLWGLLGKANKMRVKVYNRELMSFGDKKYGGRVSPGATRFQPPGGYLRPGIMLGSERPGVLAHELGHASGRTLEGRYAGVTRALHQNARSYLPFSALYGLHAARKLPKAKSEKEIKRRLLPAKLMAGGAVLQSLPTVAEEVRASSKIPKLLRGAGATKREALKGTLRGASGLPGYAAAGLLASLPLIPLLHRAKKRRAELKKVRK